MLRCIQLIVIVFNIQWFPLFSLFQHDNQYKIHLRIRISSKQVLVIDAPEVDGPWPHCPDVQGQVPLMGSRGQGERVILSFAQLQAGDAHPLTRLVGKVGGPLELQLQYICRIKIIS